MRGISTVDPSLWCPPRAPDSGGLHVSLGGSGRGTRPQRPVASRPLSTYLLADFPDRSSSRDSSAREERTG